MEIPSETESTTSNKSQRGRKENKSQSRTWKAERDSSSASGSRSRKRRGEDLFLRPDEVKQKREDSSRKTERKLKNQEEEIKDLRKKLEEALSTNNNRDDSENTNRGEITKRGDSSNRGAEAIDTTTDNANRGEVTNRGPKVEGLTITIQQKTWLKYMNRSGNKDITLQFNKVYSGTVHPFAGRFTMHMLQHWHAKPTMLNLIFSHTGEWVRILNIPNTDGGPNYFNFSIGRRERYIDEDGVIRSAVAMVMKTSNSLYGLIWRK